jgi:hypothetical protein
MIKKLFDKLFSKKEISACKNFCTTDINKAKKVIKLAMIFNVRVRNTIFSRSEDEEIEVSDNPNSYALYIDEDDKGHHLVVKELYCATCSDHKKISYEKIINDLKKISRCDSNL